MYKKNRNKQLAFEHFDQPLGLKLNPENRWVKKSRDHSMGCHRGTLCKALSKQPWSSGKATSNGFRIIAHSEAPRML